MPKTRWVSPLRGGSQRGNRTVRSQYAGYQVDPKKSQISGTSQKNANGQAEQNTYPKHSKTTVNNMQAQKCDINFPKHEAADGPILKGSQSTSRR